MRAYVILGAFALGCAVPAPRPDRAATPTAGPATRAPSQPEAATLPADAGVEQSSDAAVERALPPPTAECVRTAWAGACLSPASYRKLESAEVEAWFASQSSAAPKIDIAPSCYTGRVGAAQEPALFCEGVVHEGRGKPGQPSYVYRVLVELTVYVVRSKKPAVVFDAPIAFDVLDKDEPSGPLFALAVELRDGRELELSEPQPGACARAAEEIDRQLAQARGEHDPGARTAMSAWTSFDRALVARLCKSAGKHQWQNGRFVRARTLLPSAASSGF